MKTIIALFYSLLFLSTAGLYGSTPPASEFKSVVDFQAEFYNGAVRLFWEADSEWEYDYFIIERSQNGTTYEEIGRIAESEALFAPQRFEFMDRNPYVGQSYYRLRQVDGDIIIFQTRTNVEVDRQDVTKIFPNPARQTTIVQVRTTGIPNRILRVINMEGQVVLQRDIGPARQDIHLDLTGLDRGNYIVQIRSDRIQETHKFVKL